MLRVADWLQSRQRYSVDIGAFAADKQTVSICEMHRYVCHTGVSPVLCRSARILGRDGFPVEPELLLTGDVIRHRDVPTRWLQIRARHFDGNGKVTTLFFGEFQRNKRHSARAPVLALIAAKRKKRGSA